MNMQHTSTYIWWHVNLNFNKGPWVLNLLMFLVVVAVVTVSAPGLPTKYGIPYWQKHRTSSIEPVLSRFFVLHGYPFFAVVWGCNPARRRNGWYTHIAQEVAAEKKYTVSIDDPILHEISSRSLEMKEYVLKQHILQVQFVVVVFHMCIHIDVDACAINSPTSSVFIARPRCPSWLWVACRRCGRWGGFHLSHPKSFAENQKVEDWHCWLTNLTKLQIFFQGWFCDLSLVRLVVSLHGFGVATNQLTRCFDPWDQGFCIAPKKPEFCRVSAFEPD